LTLRGDTGPAATLAPLVFAIVTAVIALLVLWTLWLLLAGRILPPVAVPARTQAEVCLRERVRRFVGRRL
jgi:tellurite resistance protein